jgi:GrpB-like predicted nucleotidyltransferase (UPF0157 family)
MITLEQQKWIDHLSDTSKTEIFPFDPKSGDKFEQIKSQIQSILGTDIEVLHRGASSLGISGQKEIDVYIPIPPEKIDEFAVEMEKVFGKPKSIYLLERTKFLAYIDGTKLEIMLTNKDHQNWVNGERFFNYIKGNKEALESYKKLKEEGNGVSCREYYRRKTEFINDVLSKIT